MLVYKDVLRPTAVSIDSTPFWKITTTPIRAEPEEIPDLEPSRLLRWCCVAFESRQEASCIVLLADSIMVKVENGKVDCSGVTVPNDSVIIPTPSAALMLDESTYVYYAYAVAERMRERVPANQRDLVDTHLIPLAEPKYYGLEVQAKQPMPFLYKEE